MHTKQIVLSVVALLAWVIPTQAQNVNSLPVVQRQGGSYYQYKVEDGDSLYGIAKQFGWDYDLLDSLNPRASDKLRRGATLIYPITDEGNAEHQDGKISYEVTNNTNPYEIAKLLSVSTEQLYAQNPSARRGLRKGDIVTIDYSLIKSSSADSTDMIKTVSDNESDTDTQLDAAVAQRFAKTESNSDDKKSLSLTSAGSIAGSCVEYDNTLQDDDPYSSPSTRNPLFGLDTDMLMEYTIQEGDDISSVAKNFNTTVRDIYFLNPALSPAWFPESVNINLLPSSKDLDHHRAAIKSRVKTGEISYKIQADDSWSSIAHDNAISIEELQKANPQISKLKKGKKLTLPVYSTHTEWKDVVFSDPREASMQGCNEIWREVRNYGRVEKKSENDFDIALLTSTSSSDLNRDREFLRGFLLGVNERRNNDYKLGIHVLDITDQSPVAALNGDLKCSYPDVVIATIDKDFPATLADYAKQNQCALVNVFDAKSDLYASYPEISQVLIPSEEMNRGIADHVLKNFGNRQMIFLNDSEIEDDNFISLIKSELDAKNLKYEDISDATALKKLSPNGNRNLLILSNAQSQKEIRSTLQHVASLRESNPNLKISLIGRPSWIVYAQRMGQQMGKADTYIPSRFFYDEDSSRWKSFSRLYQEHYNTTPAASFPPYAALGYDTARYFIQAMTTNNGDYNLKYSFSDGVEMNFDFNRISASSGLVNSSLYFMHYSNSDVEVLQL